LMNYLTMRLFINGSLLLTMKQ